MIGQDLLLIAFLVASFLAIVLFLALSVVVACDYWNRYRQSAQLQANEQELAPHATPPPEDAAQMASIAITLLDHVTYPRQSASASVSGGDRSAETGSTASASEDCAICLGQFQVGEQCSAMPVCRHEFHRGCIANWLTAYNNTCPLCRAQLQWSTVAQDMV